MGDKPKKVKFQFPYTPRSPMQRKLAQVIQEGVAKVILCLSGVRGGKTTGAIAEGLKQHFIYKRKPKLGWVVSYNFPQSEAAEQKLVELCQTPQGSLILAKKAAKRQYLLRPTSDAPLDPFTVAIRSAQDAESLTGFSVSWIVLDEAAAMPQEVFSVAQARVMDNDGIIILSTTPRGKNWVYHDVYLRSLEDERYITIVGKTEENEMLSQEWVSTLRADYMRRGERLAKQELDGSFCDFEGRVFDHFNLSSHVVPEKALPDGIPVFCGIDWGYNDPFVCVWLAKWDGVWVVLDEYYRTRGLLAEHSKYIQDHPLAKRVKRYWADPSGLQQRKEFRNMGIVTLPARRPDKMGGPKWPSARARLINNLFSQRKKAPWGLTQDCPGLVYFDTIREGVRETEFLVYVRTTEETDRGIQVTNKDGQVVDNKNAGEIIEDRNNHFVDALGYCLFSEERINVGKPYFPGDPKEPKKAETVKTLEEQTRDAWQARFRERKDPLKPERRNHIDPYDTLGALSENH